MPEVAVLILRNLRSSRSLRRPIDFVRALGDPTAPKVEYGMLSVTVALFMGISSLRILLTL